MFRPPIVAIFREVFFEVCVMQNVKTNCIYKMLGFETKGLKFTLKYKILTFIF